MDEINNIKDLTSEQIENIKRFKNEFWIEDYDEINNIKDLTNEQIENIKKHYSPKQYIDFLKKNNGVYLFSGTFTIYGFGRIKVNGLYMISRDPLIPLPFHLFDENGRRIDKRKMKIGSVCENPLFLDNTTGEVTRLDKQGKMVEKWTSIENCTNNLVERLEKWYDKQGICTSPIIIENMFFNRVKNI